MLWHDWYGYFHYPYYCDLMICWTISLDLFCGDVSMNLILFICLCLCSHLGCRFWEGSKTFLSLCAGMLCFRVVSLVCMIHGHFAMSRFQDLLASPAWVIVQRVRLNQHMSLSLNMTKSPWSHKWFKGVVMQGVEFLDLKGEDHVMSVST
jgi:hypothetical protein